MTKKRLKVIVTRKLPEAVETRMCELFDVELNEADIALTPAQLVAAMQRADVLVPTVTDMLSADLIAQAGEQLKLIAQFGNGVNNIDVEAVYAKGIKLTNTPSVLTEDTADIAMALILNLLRRIPEGMKLIEADAWAGWSPTHLMGTRIGGKRLGIVGMGRIGLAVARRAKAFGMQIHYHNRHRVDALIEDTLEATYWESLDQMLARTDIITVHCPCTPATFHLLSARRLKLLKKDAYLINTARGAVIDEAALAKLLRDGAIAGAGLDVFEDEPNIHPDILKSNRVVLFPHIGSATLESRLAMGEKVLINIQTFADGHRPPDRVLPEMK